MQISVKSPQLWGIQQSIKKTPQYNFDTLKTHFYIVQLVFTGVNIIFLSSQKIDCGTH